MEQARPGNPKAVGEGRNFSEIGAALGLLYNTIANAANAIKSKLGAARISDLIRIWVEMRMSENLPSVLPH